MKQEHDEGEPVSRADGAAANEGTNRTPDAARGGTLSEEAVGALIREMADAWALPPRRFDPSAWRDRVAADRRPFRFRIGWPRSTSRRPLVSAVSLAIVLTLLVAVGAALVSTRPGPAASPTSRATAAASTGRRTPTPEASSGVTPTPKPLEVFGGPLPDRQIVVNDGNEGWRFLSMSTGELSQVIQPSSEGPNGQLYALPSGGFACACTTTDYQRANVSTPGASSALTQVITVTVRIFDDAGRVIREAALPPYAGVQNPQDAFIHQTVATHGTLAPDGRTLFLGWVIRSQSGWRNGIDVIDIGGTPRMVQSVALDTIPFQRGGVQLFVWTGPQVYVAPDGSHLVVVRSLDEGDQGGQTVDRFSAAIADGRIGKVTKMKADFLAAGACSAVGFQGFAGSTAFYDLCGMTSSLMLRRVDLAGALLGDTPLPNVGVIGYVGSLANDSTSSTLYAWGPGTGTLTRVDLVSGRVTGSLTLPQTTADAGGGLIGALLGRLVPTAFAKEILVPSIALSPDGTRIYLIGTTSSDPSVPGQSTGVWIVDARSLTLVGHWAPPRADLMSVTVSPDGAFVVAAGRPGTQPGSSDQASVSVYEAATGRLRLFASQLGANELFLGGQVP